ncbi:MAG: DNA/RNA nuclease SfsA, partial [Chloroflexi bacterium]|nr:DNA/RNA nuclease SfsA [Chloroflexota bacterium]
MRFPPLHEAQFLTRLNRFAALVLLDGEEVMVHVANSGRMRELLQPGNTCYLTHHPGEHRKTAYDLTLVAIDRNPANAIGEPIPRYASKLISPQNPSPPDVGQGRALVSADSRVPNALIWETWQEGGLPQFSGYTDGRREVTFHDSRLDMMLDGPNGKCYIEMKSVTLVVDGIARFPDAPTERGRKHVATLMKAVEEGHRAAAVFVIQRDDATGLTPYDANDPEFGTVLREAVAAGVEAYAFTCTLTQQE